MCKRRRKEFFLSKGREKWNDNPNSNMKPNLLLNYWGSIYKKSSLKIYAEFVLWLHVIINQRKNCFDDEIFETRWHDLIKIIQRFLLWYYICCFKRCERKMVIKKPRKNFTKVEEIFATSKTFSVSLDSSCRWYIQSHQSYMKVKNFN